MSKKQIEESLNYKKYRTLSKVPDDILRKYQVENRIEETNNKKSQWKYWIVAVFVVVAISGIGIFAGLNRRDDTVSFLNGNVESEMVIEESQNVLMADVIKLPESVLTFEGELQVFESEIDRREVMSITFLDTLEDAPDDCWDVSYDQNGTVFAWAEKQGDFYDLYIAAEGGVKGKNCYFLFAGYSAVKTINFNECFDTSDVMNMDYMFAGCEKLAAVDVENLNTKSVTDMEGMFLHCETLNSLDVGTWETCNLVDAGDMFSDCYNLQALDVSAWDTNSLTNAGQMFDACQSLESLDVSDWDMGAAIKVAGMFQRCYRLTALDVSALNTSSVEDMSWMFCDCFRLQTLDVSNWDTGNVENMWSMFSGCENLTTLDVSNWDTSNVTSMRRLFYNCTKLTLLDTSNWDKSNVEDMHAMYYGVDESALKQYK